MNSAFNHLEQKLSFYASAKDVSPTKSISVSELVRMIHDEDTGTGVALVRQAESEDAKRAAKMRLPAVQISGYVTQGNRAQAMQEGRFVHSGWLQLDVDGDGLNGKTPDEARALLAADPHVLSAFISPSGEGAKALFRGCPCQTVEEHKTAFLAAEKYIWGRHGLNIDKATKDPGRLCYIPSDPDCTWNASALEFKPPAVSAPEAPPRSTGFPEPPQHGIHAWMMAAAWHCRFAGMSEGAATEKLNSYDGSLRRSFQPNEAETAARTVFASPFPDSRVAEIPEMTFPIPGGEISFTQSAGVIFPVIGKAQKLFTREGVIHEVKSAKGISYLEPLDPDRFCSLVEKFGHRIAKREIIKTENTGTRIVWRSSTMPVHTAKILLATDQAITSLPTIRQLVGCPVLIPPGEILGQGYHKHAGGTFITGGAMPPIVPLEHAKAALLSLLDDFAFVTPSDKSRALASLISPALKMGGWIEDDFPLDLAEADQSQSGKTYRFKIITAIFNEEPSGVIAPRGGVGSLDEAISTELIKGRPFIILDNFRGRLDSTILEQAIRGLGSVSCRALRKAATVDCKPFLWQLSTNGAELTRDAANRAIITRIRKQPEGFSFRQYPEGGLFAHVKANQAFYLGAVFSIIREWSAQGCHKTNERRHDFAEWCGALDWIVQRVFQMEPLLNGHREEQARTSNPDLQWLREIVLAATPGDIGRRAGVEIFLTIAEDNGIQFPGNPHSKDDPAIRAGRILGKLYREASEEILRVDGFTITREVAPDYTPAAAGGLRKFYTITSP